MASRSGPCPRRRRPAAGRRPDPCRARWRHSSPRPPPPQRAEGLRLGLQQFHLHGQIRFMALSSACTGSPLRCLSEASIPPVAFSRHCSSRSPTGAAKAAERPHACAPPSIAGQVPAGLPAKPGLGKTWRAKLARTTGPSTATFFSKLSVMFRSSLDTSIKPILCPRKSGPTHLANTGAQCCRSRPEEQCILTWRISFARINPAQKGNPLRVNFAPLV